MTDSTAKERGLVEQGVLESAKSILKELLGSYGVWIKDDELEIMASASVKVFPDLLECVLSCASSIREVESSVFSDRLVSALKGRLAEMRERFASEANDVDRHSAWTDAKRINLRVVPVKRGRPSHSCDANKNFEIRRQRADLEEKIDTAKQVGALSLGRRLRRGLRRTVMFWHTT